MDNETLRAGAAISTKSAGISWVQEPIRTAPAAVGGRGPWRAVCWPGTACRGRDSPGTRRAPVALHSHCSSYRSGHTHIHIKELGEHRNNTLFCYIWHFIYLRTLSKSCLKDLLSVWLSITLAALPAHSETVIMALYDSPINPWRLGERLVWRLENICCSTNEEMIPKQAQPVHVHSFCFEYQPLWRNSSHQPGFKSWNVFLSQMALRMSSIYLLKASPYSWEK